MEASKIPRAPQEGGMVQGWESVCGGVLGIPLLENKQFLTFQSFKAARCQSFKVAKLQHFKKRHFEVSAVPTFQTSKLQCFNNSKALNFIIPQIPSKVPEFVGTHSQSFQKCHI